MLSVLYRLHLSLSTCNFSPQALRIPLEPYKAVEICPNQRHPR
jgi:hypothetical protein